LSSEFTDFDRDAMARAVELARNGLDTTHPNPRVGCVLARDGKIIGEGWHERAGGPHAEIVALRSVDAVGAAGATAYVTLEPCSHHGRTPPCVDALIEARVSRVVFAMRDPDRRVSGRGAEALAKAGIVTQVGLMTEAAEELNVGYLKRMRTGKPWMRLKLAMSLDGRTALANGVSKWITGEAARADVQHWRARSSAVLTGIGTVLADNPRLDVRLPGAMRQPVRVVLDSTLRVPMDARLFDTAGDLIFLAANGDSSQVASAGQLVTREPRFSTHDADIEHRAAALRNHGARVERVTGATRPDLRAVISRLSQLEMNEVLIEAGPELSGAFLREGLIDELVLYVAPKILGPQAKALVDLPALTELSAAPRFTLVEETRIGEDLRLRLRPAVE
jgi:diaminohydroxyphosphoribosylaminopyrimidine deaminase / 5-amino-6-(5-phosphoribosylamino)uracil reductase